MANREDTLEAVALQLEVLAAQLRLLGIAARNGTEDGPVPQRVPPVPPPAAPPAPPRNAMRVGSRVLLIRSNDTLRGRTGVITGRRGIIFWYLRIDAHGEERAGPTVYRQEASLQLLHGAERQEQ
jgi:hypothetical protein